MYVVTGPEKPGPIFMYIFMQFNETFRLVEQQEEQDIYMWPLRVNKCKMQLNQELVWLDQFMVS